MRPMSVPWSSATLNPSPPDDRRKVTSAAVPPATGGGTRSRPGPARAPAAGLPHAAGTEACLVGVILDVARSQQPAGRRYRTAAPQRPSSGARISSARSARSGSASNEAKKGRSLPGRDPRPGCARISPGVGRSPASGSRSARWCSSSRIALMHPVQARQPPMADARNATAWLPSRQFSARPGGQQPPACRLQGGMVAGFPCSGGIGRATARGRPRSCASWPRGVSFSGQRHRARGQPGHERRAAAPDGLRPRRPALPGLRAAGGIQGLARAARGLLVLPGLGRRAGRGAGRRLQPAARPGGQAAVPRDALLAWRRHRTGRPGRGDPVRRALRGIGPGGPAAVLRPAAGRLRRPSPHGAAVHPPDRRGRRAAGTGARARPRPGRARRRRRRGARQRDQRQRPRHRRGGVHRRAHGLEPAADRRPGVGGGGRGPGRHRPRPGPGAAAEPGTADVAAGRGPRRRPARNRNARNRRAGKDKRMTTWIKVARFHLADRLSYTALPWGVLSINLAIYLAIAAGANKGGSVQIPSANLGAIYLFFFIAGVLSIGRSLPFAFALGVGRRSYYAGTALLAVSLAAADGLALAVLHVIEQATGGWGVHLHFFRVAYILAGPWYLSWLTSFVGLALMFIT